MPKLAAVPAVNKEGFSRVTFLGYEDGYKEYEVTDKETGEVSKAKREYTKLKFEILDKTKVDPIKTNVVGQALNERELWETVKALGYVEPDTEDDLEDSDDDLDDETYSKALDQLTSITNFLDDIVDKRFLCKVERDKRGYWAIKPETLKPYVPKSAQ